jgi:hypothetical protein
MKNLHPDFDQEHYTYEKYYGIPLKRDNKKLSSYYYWRLSMTDEIRRLESRLFEANRVLTWHSRMEEGKSI